MMQTSFDAKKYVEENSYPLVLPDKKDLGLALRCIDDRASDSDDRARGISIPGAGLGLVMDVLGAFTLLRRAGKHATLAPSEAIAAVERAIGAICFHTDDKSVKNRGLACGGCGHASGALADPLKYLLSEGDAEFFIEKGLGVIKDGLKSRGVKPAVYHGAHAASAVIIVEGTDVGLPSVGKSGERAFVYHQDLHEMLLQLVAAEIAPLLASHTKGIDEEALASALRESARMRLDVTLEKLAAGLPRFVVDKRESLLVNAL